VDDLAADVERASDALQGKVDDLDGPDDARAEAARRSEQEGVQPRIGGRG
jgi:hypothetical protein